MSRNQLSRFIGLAIIILSLGAITMIASAQSGVKPNLFAFKSQKMAPVSPLTI